MKAMWSLIYLVAVAIQVVRAGSVAEDIVSKESGIGKEEKPQIEIIETAIIGDKYLAKVGILLDKHSVAQNDLTIAIRAPLGQVYVKAWISHDLANNEFGKEQKPGGDEIQGWIGWKHQYKDWIRFDQSFAYFVLSPSVELATIHNDLLLSHSRIEIVKEKKFITPYLEFRYYWDAVSAQDPKKSKEGGFSWIGAYRTFEIGKRASVTIDGCSAFSQGALGRDAGPVFLQGRIGTDVKLWKGLSAVSNITYNLPFSNQEGGKRDYCDYNKPQTAITFGLKWKF